MESSGFGLLTHKTRMRGDIISMQGICALKFPRGMGTPDMKRLEFRIGDGQRQVIRSEFSKGKGLPFIGGYRLHTFRMEMRTEDILQLDIQNKLYVYYDDQEISDVSYNILEKRRGSYHNTRVMSAGGKSIYFRQNVNNKLWLVVRPPNIYDDPSAGPRVFFAWLLAKLPGGPEPILMYEKEASRYEESASVLFEKLIDSGYQNIYYIVNPDNPAIRHLDARYRNKMIDKDSFRHLKYFFRCRTFIGTETLDHALQLRAANRRIMSKAQSTDVTHVFLQHGVMYMVSLDADLRVGFVSRKVKRYRTVVSSEAEAMHFILLGGFKREELYVTGLAKFDRSFRMEDADRIMIMPTWRRWETNLAETDFEQTGYYRMLERMVAGVPEDLRDKIIIKPHPLMQSMMEQNQTPLSRYLRPELSHDDTLRQCRVLVTDYSSIAYDAFYRGANVIFCWEDMVECMKHYGGAHLMINEYNIFGDICRGSEDLAKVMRRNYEEPQTPLYRRRYGNIVNFSDNRNTERIIACLKKDRIL